MLQIERMPWVQEALAKTQEVGCNLDQDPSFAEHCGTILPVVLASVSNMYLGTAPAFLLSDSLASDIATLDLLCCTGFTGRLVTC